MKTKIDLSKKKDLLSNQFHSIRWSTEENGVCEEIDGLRGMELAMDAWANWVESNVDPMKKVFFVTMSPTHLL